MVQVQSSAMFYTTKQTTNSNLEKFTEEWLYPTKLQTLEQVSTISLKYSLLTQ